MLPGATPNEARISDNFQPIGRMAAWTGTPNLLSDSSSLHEGDHRGFVGAGEAHVVPDVAAGVYRIWVRTT